MENLKPEEEKLFDLKAFDEAVITDPQLMLLSMLVKELRRIGELLNYVVFPPVDNNEEIKQ